MVGFRISASRNRLHALALKGFDFGVIIQPPGSRKTGDFATRRTFADNAVSGVVMRGIRVQGIVLDAAGAGAGSSSRSLARATASSGQP